MKLCKFFVVAFFIYSINASAATSSISFVYPAGGQVGATNFIVEVGGYELADTTEPLFSHDGITGKLISVDPLPKDRQAAAKRRDEPGEILVAKFAVNIAPDVPVGLYQIRVAGKKEISNAMVFMVGDLEEVKEVGNVSVDDPQDVFGLPAVVNGRIYEGDIDAYSFKGIKGQKLLIRIDARSIKPYLADAVPGWFQAVISLHNSKGKNILTVDDYKNLPDSVIIFDVLETGKYTVKVHDSIYRGRDDFVYRLTIGELPFITSVYPMGFNARSNSVVSITGINLPKSEVKANKKERTVAVWNGNHKSNVLPVELSHAVEIIEVDDYKTNSISTRMVVNGRINYVGDEDIFEINMQSNKWYNFDVNARTLGSPLDAKLVLYNNKGRVLAKNDDQEDLYCGMAIHFADSHISYHSPRNQKAFIAIGDTQGKGGEEYTYRLLSSVSLTPFDVRIMPDVNFGQPGGNLPIKAQVFRRNGFRGEVILSATGFPEGTDFSNAKIPARQNSATFTVKLPDDMPKDKIFNPVWTAEAKVWGDRIVKRPASYAEDQMQAFIYHHILPMDKGYVIPTEPAPFKIFVESEEKPIKFKTWGNKTLTFKIEFTDEAFKEELIARWKKRKANSKNKNAKKMRPPAVRVQLENAPPAFTMEPLKIPITTNQITAVVKVKKGTPMKDNLIFSASIKNGKKLELTRSPAIPYEVVAKKWKKKSAKKLNPKSLKQLEQQAKKNNKK